MTNGEIIDKVLEKHSYESINGRRMYTALDVVKIIEDTLSIKREDDERNRELYK